MEVHADQTAYEISFSFVLKRVLLLIVSICLLCCSCCTHQSGAQPTFSDTLPCNANDGNVWLAIERVGNTGDVDILQTYIEDDTFAPLGATGYNAIRFEGVSPGNVVVRLYYVSAAGWTGVHSDVNGAAYYEFQVLNDLSIKLLYSEVEFPDLTTTDG